MTYEAADSERYVAEAFEDGSYDTIVAAGGDGSINQVGANFGHASSQEPWACLHTLFATSNACLHGCEIQAKSVPCNVL